MANTTDGTADGIDQESLPDRLCLAAADVLDVDGTAISVYLALTSRCRSARITWPPPSVKPCSSRCVKGPASRLTTAGTRSC